MRQKHGTVFKVRVALEALKGEKSLSQLNSEFGVHPAQIRLRRDKALGALPGIFSRGESHNHKERENLEEELYQRINQLKVERD